MARKKTVKKKILKQKPDRKPLLGTVFVLLIVFAAALLVLSSIQPKPFVANNTQQPACKENLTSDCYIGSCTGQHSCINGQWSDCELHRICVPGHVEPCVVEYCATSYKTCNECGTGYGPCLPRNSS